MSETIVVPWYATGFRADGFEAALNEIAQVAMHYGASSFQVYRSEDDRYRFQQFVTFEDHLDWERYWEGPEMCAFRARHSGWYQIPVLYAAWRCTAAGSIEPGSAPHRAASASNSAHSPRFEAAEVEAV